MKVATCLFIAMSTVTSYAQTNLCCSSAADVQELLRSIADSTSESVPKPEELGGQIADVMQTAPITDIKAILELAGRCVASSKLSIRRDGLMVMLSATVRSDSEQAFEPNIEQIGSLLSDSEEPVRKAAIFILGNTKPRVLPAAAMALKAHLRDKSNSVAETLSITAALLKAGPADTSTVHTVVGLAGSSADPALRDGIIRQLGLFQVESEEALSTVKAGLDDSDSDVRKASLDAIDRMNSSLRGRFTSQVTRIAEDSQEREDVRQLANKVLANPNKN